MKTLLTATLTVLLFAGSAAMADSHHDRGHDGRSRHDPASQPRHFNNDHHGNDRRNDGRRDWDRRDSRQHFDRSLRDPRSRDNGFRHDHRDDNRHWQGGSRWNSYSPSFGYRPHRWYRGAHLPVAYFSSRYVVYDYSSYRLRRPPRGYHWIRVNSDLLLVAIATGLVVDVVGGY
jgi:Ni/Co efflux regulator RcnB